ncbi:serine proteinase stubble-like [Argiope bruennichi]|uniref:serine proteinase stubble-like n=1 Tax=Argiope bruennichi TaxID=94029 RepID=UPI00249599FA|nr:serine proteinase stubble-like [Argiope bruennichi]
MNSYLFALFLCGALLYQTESLPRWSWSKLADLESLPPQKEKLKDCVDGQCLQAWKCPENETALKEPTVCSRRSGGPWICCIRFPKNESIKFTEKSEATTSHFIERLIESTKDSRFISISTTPDWISVEAIAERNEKENSSSQNTVAEYKQNEKIVNWGKSHAYSPKHSYEDSRNNVASNNAYKPYVWSKGSTSGPFSRITEVNWLNPVSAELRNKYPSETDYDTAPENSWDKSWDYNHNIHSTKKTTKNWIVKPTPSSRWSSTKPSWNRDHTSSKTTNKWEIRTTASSWVRPVTETRDKVPNSRDTVSTPVAHSWTKSTKSVHDWNYSSDSYGSTKTREISTTSKPRTKSTAQSWRATASFQKSNNTRSTVNTWVKPTKESWNWDSSSNTEKKSTKFRPNVPTTSKSTTKKSTRTSSTTKLISKPTAVYTSKQTINNRLTTPKSSFTRSTVSTQKPWGVSFENIEKSRSSSRIPSVGTRSTTKKNSRTTPLPDVNSQRCGIRVTNRGASRRSKRQSSSEEFVYTDGSEAGRNRSPFQRIVGGKEVDPFSWPWMAALYRVSESGGNRFLSAGSLINRNFVLTAAHVFTPDDLRSASFVVMLGTHTAREAVAEYVVMYVLRHPNYQQRYYYNDIALLRLERAVDFNEYVMPVCLPSPSLPLVKDEDLEGKPVTVMGWGDESYGGKTSRVLREASFPIVPRKSCNESYFRVASNRFPRGITSNMLCAGDPNGGKDACQGDSGGPLTAVENGRHTQVGIVSFGYKCGDKEYPGVYTKVAPYLSWIAENARCDDYSDYPNYYSR